MKKSRFPLAVTVLVLIFFYLPIIILIVNSFNAARFSSRWQGFTLDWYARLFHSPEIWLSVRNTLLIAVSSTAVSLVLGTAAAFALHRFAGSRLQRMHYTLIYTPLILPGLAAGGLLAFTLSVDDFVITFFVAGPGSTTLPLRIYSMIKYGNPPMINALSTLLLAVTLTAVIASQRLARLKR